MEAAKNLENKLSKPVNLKTERIEDAVGELRHNLEDRYEALQEQVKKLTAKSKKVVTENPVYAVAGAAAIGFLAGVVIARKR